MTGAKGIVVERQCRFEPIRIQVYQRDFFPPGRITVGDIRRLKRRVVALLASGDALFCVWIRWNSRSASSYATNWCRKPKPMTPANKITGETRLLYVRTPPPIFMRLLVGMLGLAFVVVLCFILFTPADWPKTVLHWLMLLPVAYFGYAFVQVATFSGEIRFDPVARELLVITRGVLPRRYTRHFPVAPIRAVRTRYSHAVMGGSHWELWLDYAAGKPRILNIALGKDPDGTSPNHCRRHRRTIIHHM